ncbi:hypothetical protein AB0R12_11450, partial [Streptomyces niveus]
MWNPSWQRTADPDPSTARTAVRRPPSPSRGPPRPPVSKGPRVHGLTNERLENEPGWEEIADQVHTLMG